MPNGHDVSIGGVSPPKPWWNWIIPGIFTVILLPAAFNALFNLPPRVSANEATQKSILRDIERIDNQKFDSRIGYQEGKTDAIKDRVDKLESRLDNYIMNR